MTDASPTYGATQQLMLAPRKTSLEDCSPYIAEFVGTLVLVFTVGCVLLSPASAAWGPTAIACVLMAMIYGTAEISGGNLNPAVSLSLFMTGHLSWNVCVKYWIAQIAGGLVAGLGFCVVFYPRSLTIEPGNHFTWGHAALAEMLYTFMLCFVVLNCAASKRNNPKDDPNQFFALAIGFVIIAGGYAVGGISGACFNPAVTLGIAGAGSGLGYASIWIGAQFLGSLLSVLAFRFLHGDDEESLEDNAPTLAARCASEFLGTFILVLTVGLNLISSSLSTAWSAAAALMCMIYSLGNVSGAHFNPAVTLGIVVSGRGKCSAQDGLAYAVFQLLGGFCAGLLYATFHAAGPNRDKTYALEPGESYGLYAACFVELIFTYVLVYVVLACATAAPPASWATKQSFYFALAIGSCVTAGGTAIAAVSGGELNPAVSVGIAAANLVHHGKVAAPSFWNCIVFSLWELGGGLLAAGIFRLTHPQEYEVGSKEAALPA